MLGALLLQQLFPPDAVEATRLGATLALDAEGVSKLSTMKIIIVEAILTFSSGDDDLRRCGG